MKRLSKSEKDFIALRTAYKILFREKEIIITEYGRRKRIARYGKCGEIKQQMAKELEIDIGKLKSKLYM